MTWEYGVIGLITGMLIGVLAMFFSNSNLCRQQKLKNELDRKSIDFEEYRQELVDHFARNAALLDNMASNYRQLYQHIAKNSNNLLPDLPLQDNVLNSYNRNNKSDGDKPQVKVPPLDYF